MAKTEGFDEWLKDSVAKQKRKVMEERLAELREQLDPKCFDVDLIGAIMQLEFWLNIDTDRIVKNVPDDGKLSTVEIGNGYSHSN